MITYKDLNGNRHELPNRSFAHVLPAGCVEMTEEELAIPYEHPPLSLELELASKEAKGMSLRRLRESIIAGTLGPDMVALETEMAVIRNKIKQRAGKL